MPFHAALDPEYMPLIMKRPVVIAQSLNAFCVRNESFADTIQVDDGDDFVAVNSLQSEESEGSYPGLTSWMNNVDAKLSLSVFGAGSSSLQERKVMGKRSIPWPDFLKSLSSLQPEFFIWITHGVNGTSSGAMQYREDSDKEDFVPIVPTDLIMSTCLRRNKLTVLVSCMAAQWEIGERREGEISGFIRAFRGTGAGVVFAPRWQVGVTEAGHWLTCLAKRLKVGKDVLRASDLAHSITKYLASNTQDVQQRLAACVFCPFV